MGRGKDTSCRHAEFEVRGYSSRGIRRKMFIARGKVWGAIHRKLKVEAVTLDERQAQVLDRRSPGPGSLYGEEEMNCHQQTGSELSLERGVLKIQTL